MGNGKTIPEILIAHMEGGYGLCHGVADRITGSQSGGRELRRLIEKNPDHYKYFMAKGKKKRVYYRVFFIAKKLPVKLISIKHDLVANEWRVSALISRYETVDSKRFKTKKEARECIKKCLIKEKK